MGGGPAGSATAARLAREGRDVVLLEKGEGAREKPCGGYYDPGVVDALGRLGALESVLAGPVARPDGMRLFAGGKSFFLSYPGDSGEAPGHAGRAALGVTRLRLDGALLEHARASGARIIEGARVRGAEVEDGRVVGVRVRLSGGQEGFVSSRVVVAADGRNSAVARSLGLVRPVRPPFSAGGRPIGAPFRLGLHALYRAEGAEEIPGEMHVGGRGSYCGLAPVGGGLVSVGLVVGMGAKPPGEGAEAFLGRTIREDLPGVARTLSEAGAERVSKVRGVGPLARRVARVSGPGYLLVGDAAGFRDPFTGEGVFRALRGAEVAAEGVLEALSRADGVPEGYGEARRRVFADKERLVDLVQALLVSPRLFGYVLERLEKRPGPAAAFKGALGDYRPAAAALGARPLWSVMRP